MKILISVFLCNLFGFSTSHADIKCSLGLCDDHWMQILFVGNSYTQVNNLPEIFMELAKSGGFSIKTEMIAPGGWTLLEHSKSSETLDKIKSTKWNFVVLQEQSQIPSLEPSREFGMYPAARILVQKIRETGATPLFFTTWARKEGWPEKDLKDYETMQEHINEGYAKIARELSAASVPVGQAWSDTVKKNPALQLWQQDGSHPSIFGTYLAACVFYSVIFRKSPYGLWFPKGIDENTAHILQQSATAGSNL